MDESNLKTTPQGQFRQFLPDLSQGKYTSLPSSTATTWGDEFFKSARTRALVDSWLALREESYIGLTNNGKIKSDLYQHEDHGIDTEALITAVQDVFNLCTAEQLESLCEPLNSKVWRSWSNPEIYFSRYGLRLENLPLRLSDAILVVIQHTLSPKGFIKVRDAMRTNHFLGSLCNGRGVMNDRSYNFVIFGEPSSKKAWGWNIYGHHLCMNAFVDNGDIWIAPVFIGAEPNEIDEGIYNGTVMLKGEEALGLKLMQSLSSSQQGVAQIYKEMHDEKMPPGRWNKADQRHLCGAFQDNRVVPYEGIKVSELSSDQQSLIIAIVEEFLVYLPEPALRKRMSQIKHHFSQTYFSWIGAFGDSDPFYYRIQSPVLVIEFDHHSGVFLANKEPEKFHIHTIARAPNAGDYGNALRETKDRLQ